MEVNTPLKQRLDLWKIMGLIPRLTRKCQVYTPMILDGWKGQGDCDGNPVVGACLSLSQYTNFNVCAYTHSARNSAGQKVAQW